MPNRHDKLTIISMAVVASASATLLHEGVGHGLTAWLRGDIPTELTSNHLSSLRPDRWVDAGGTLVNLIVGASSLLVSRVAGDCANVRYFFWIFAAFNLLHGAGHFLFSGISGFGELAESRRIYRLSLAGSPESNSERATLLKQHFLEHYRALQKNTSTPRILLKFGDDHMWKGFNDTHQLDLGDYVAELASFEHTTSLHIQVIAARGALAGFSGYAKPMKDEPFVLSDVSRV